MQAIKSYIDNNGKLSIPIKVRNLLSLKPGDKVEINCIDNKLVVISFREKLAHARSIVKQYVNGSLTEDLRKMRAEDAAKE